VFKILPPLRETEYILQEESRILQKNDQILEDKDQIVNARGCASIGETAPSSTDSTETDDTEDESEAEGEPPTGKITPMLSSSEKWIFTYPPEQKKKPDGNGRESHGGGNSAEIVRELSAFGRRIKQSY